MNQSIIFYRIKFWIVPASIIILLLTNYYNLHNDKMSKQEENLLDASSIFATNLHKILAKAEGNLIFSPISVHAVLSMIHQGAAGTTLQVLREALQIDHTTSCDGYNSIMERLHSLENVTLALANKVYVMQGFQLKNNFKNTLVKDFKSEVENIDFAQQANSTATINNWVEKQTNHKIKNLLDQSAVNEKTRLVLINAIYFKGNWAHPFESLHTAQKPFHINEKDSVDVATMFIKKKFHYKHCSELNAQILKMPYQNENISMVFVLPDETNGITQLEAKLNSINLTTILEDAGKTEVHVFLPKFKTEATISLREVLQKMGLSDLFDEEKADFSNMVESKENLFVSKVVQKAFIEVNEEGAEAAAATAAVVRVKRCMMVSEPIRFVADHPFLFYIVDYGYSGKANVMFSGRIMKPEYF